MFKARARPFVLVYWSRDPDGSQHNQGDSFGQLQPGINGPTSLAGIRNADDNLRRLREALVALDLRPTTNIIVAADHGFSTVSRESATSPAARKRVRRRGARAPAAGFPGAGSRRGAGFAAVGSQPAEPPRRRPGEHTNGNGVHRPRPVRARRDRRGRRRRGVDLFARHPARARWRRASSTALMAQDYVSGIFADDALGVDCGHAADERDSSRGPRRDPPAVAGRQPAIVLHRVCGRDQLQRHGLERRRSRGRGTTADSAEPRRSTSWLPSGPSFKSGFVDTMPVGNVDVHPTIARIMRLPREARGTLTGEGARGSAR